jgi:hypothetical protein
MKKFFLLVLLGICILQSISIFSPSILDVPPGTIPPVKTLAYLNHHPCEQTEYNHNL